MQFIAMDGQAEIIINTDKKPDKNLAINDL